MRRTPLSEFAGGSMGVHPPRKEGTMTAIFSEPRKNRLIHERIHDAYKPTRKLREPSVCPVCRAVFKGGRWQWLPTWPTHSHREICHACRRIKDNYPAGMVTMSGDFLKAHRREILGLTRNTERAERNLHPLHRIMKVEERPGAVVVSTTDIHLPKRIGQALRRAYKGRLELRYAKESCFLRVTWTSNSKPGGSR
jgi:hypothetical protein